MICDSCHAPVANGARFCGRCGAERRVEDPAAVDEYRRCVIELVGNGAIEAWHEAELAELRAELEVGLDTHKAVLVEVLEGTRTHSVGAWVDAATMADFRVGQQCLVRLRLMNEGRRALRHAQLRWGSSASSERGDSVTGLLGPGQSEVVTAMLTPSVAGHHELDATVSAVGLRGGEEHWRVHGVGFRVGAAGALQQTIHIDARSQRVGIFENIGGAEKGALLDGADWRRVRLEPVAGFEAATPAGPEPERLDVGHRGVGTVLRTGAEVIVAVGGSEGRLVEHDDPGVAAILAAGDRLQVSVIGVDRDGVYLLSTERHERRSRPPAVAAAAAIAVTGSLAEAIAQAGDGAVLDVPAGRHAGPVVLSRRIELRGAPGAIVEAARGPVVTVHADAVIHGLVIRGTAGKGAYAPDGVEVRGGRVVLRACTVQTTGPGNLTPGRGVAVTGGAAVEVRDCDLLGNGVGVAIDVSWAGFATTGAAGARVAVSDCRFVENGVGVAIAGPGREVRVVASQFENQQQGAVRVLGGATAAVDGCRVDPSELTADAESSLTARGNHR